MVAKLKKSEENGTSPAQSRLPADIVQQLADVGKMEQITIRFTGITPLMQCSTRGMDLSKSNKKKGVNVGGATMAKEKEKTPDEICELGTYPTGDGTFYHPAAAFRSAMIEACHEKGVGFTIKGASGRDKTQYLHDRLRGSFFNLDDSAVLLHPKSAKPLTAYKRDFRIGRNKNAGNAPVELHRPKWEEWMCEVEFEYDPDVIDPEVILMAANLAGARAGIGCMRPLPPAGKFGKREGMGGRFGKFRAEIVK